LIKDHLERSPNLYLQEIIEFIEKIQDYTKDMSYEEFAKDSKTIDAVDSNIRKIGEAVRVLAKRRVLKDLFYRFRIPYGLNSRIFYRQRQSHMENSSNPDCSKTTIFQSA
jgi:hypothetical protein